MRVRLAVLHPRPVHPSQVSRRPEVGRIRVYPGWFLGRHWQPRSVSLRRNSNWTTPPSLLLNVCYACGTWWVSFKCIACRTKQAEHLRKGQIAITGRQWRSRQYLSLALRLDSFSLGLGLGEWSRFGPRFSFKSWEIYRLRRLLFYPAVMNIILTTTSLLVYQHGQFVTFDTVNTTHHRKQLRLASLLCLVPSASIDRPMFVHLTNCRLLRTTLRRTCSIWILTSSHSKIRLR